MQGLQALDQFKSFVSKIGGLGRYEDTYIVHAAEGETVVPMEVLDQNPLLKKRLFKTMMDMGIEPGRYIVGNDLNSKNPVTGQPEFFLKKIVDRLKKAAADVSGYAAPIVGAMYGAPAGALAGGILGSFKRENPGDPRQGLNMALRGGLAGIASNLTSGQKMLGGRGAYGIYGKGLKPFDVAGLGRRMLGRGNMGFEAEGIGYQGPKGLDEFYKEGAITDAYNKYMGGEELTGGEDKISSIISEAIKNSGESEEKIADALKQLSGASKSEKMSFLQKMKIGIPIWLAMGYGLDKTTDKGNVGQRHVYEPHRLSYESLLNPQLTYAAQGGVMDLQEGGESKGPGTGTSDSIPAMLSDGEFVMTAEAVRGAGGGDRREGARKMYEAMDRLEARA